MKKLESLELIELLEIIRLSYLIGKTDMVCDRNIDTKSLMDIKALVEGSDYSLVEGSDGGADNAIALLETFQERGLCRIKIER